ncbi:hybrid sensor histidine kinase/response regulator [Actinoplanes solisilvae]|uniref:hybrid sensor histidine kinase/response regulator n=1 Tax=Actinoplanes solisilvae TaxID=2486853 RepID=UPI001F0C3A7E|nr:PAS domain S-box protein [Actinoplanes solisilvae]
MPEQVYLLGNLVIMVAYAAIMMAIIVPIARAGQLRSNTLGVATAMIFFTCSVGHGLHGYAAIRDIEHLSTAFIWPSAIWDAFTAAVGVYYWTLRRSYKVLLEGGTIYSSPGEQHRLAEADARELAALNAAEKHRATLAAVVEHTDDAIIGVNLEARVTAWNRGAERLFGYNAGAMIGQPMSLFSGDASAAADQLSMIARIRHGERRIHYEARRVHRNGSPLELSVNMAPIRDAAGVVTGASITAREISALKEEADRRRAEEDRAIQAQRMESLGKLAGGIAHDFNNILAIIVNYTEFAIEETKDQGVRDDLAHVRSAADRAMALTRQLLTFTRGDGAQPRDLDLNAALEEAREALAADVGENVSITTRPASGPLSVHADPGQLRQVLHALAVNARDAMPEGGTLVLEANTAEGPPGLPPGVYARLLVSDTGEGMTPEVAERVFEPFFTTKPGKGAGMGLSTAYGIVSEAGGSIAVYTEPRVGTTFRIYLPLTTVPGMPGHRSAPPSGDGRTVLVVEHEPALMRAATRILTVAGYQVLAASTGPEALVVLGDRQVDGLVTDVVMPDMSGPRLAELLHERWPDLPVVFMSGYSSGMLDVSGMLAPGSPFVEKPFTASDLLHRVHDALGDRTHSAV